MKHFLSNAFLMVLLVGLLVAPLSGFYLFGYKNLSNSGYKIPDYVPIKISNPSTSEVLSEEDVRPEDVAESSAELEYAATENSAELQVSEVKNDEEELVENELEEFDPTTYSPANKQ